MEVGRDEVLMGCADRRSHTVVRGKRTKRPRSSSPLVAMTSSSSSGCSGGGDFVGSAVEDYNSASCLVATTSGDSATEEDEDMANCLIMLARGEGPPPPPSTAPARPKPEKTEKHGARRTEISVFECKTCNRSFPSFQALGGHRASHKKPKMEAKPVVSPTKEEPLDEGHSDASPPLIPLPASNANTNTNAKVNKTHECSICGSEFTSGQALGGHMRRHRPAAAAANTANQIPAIGSSSSNDSTAGDQQTSGVRKLLPLDLNLPAPEDFHFGSNSQQNLVFSAAPTLVDCHY